MSINNTPLLFNKRWIKQVRNNFPDEQKIQTIHTFGLFFMRPSLGLV